MDYQNGKIYTIRSPHTPKYYIGGTTQPLSKRFSFHKYRQNCRSREIINLGDAYIELMENYPCNNKMELDKREGELQRLHKADIVNFRMEARTEEEKIAQKKHLDGLPKSLERNREYKKTHKKQCDEKVKEYRELNRQTINTKQNNSRELNREEFNAQAREYKTINKDKINARRRELRRLKKESNLVDIEKK